MQYKERSVGNGGKLCLYLWDNSRELYDGLLRPVIVICPGGAYAMTSDREAEGMAVKFMSMGFHAAVLRYSVAPARYPEALQQLAESVKIIRQNCKEWYVDPDRIVVQGSSAGGHLAASLGVFWNKGFLSEALQTSSDRIRPNGLILSYPVISSGEFGHQESFQNLLGEAYQERKEEMSLEKQVSADTPKTFLWHTFEDETVPVENSLLFVSALRKQGISTEFHMYPNGVHGLGTASHLTKSSDGRGIQNECATWMLLAEMWIRKL